MEIEENLKYFGSPLISLRSDDDDGQPVKDVEPVTPMAPAEPRRDVDSDEEFHNFHNLDELDLEEENALEVPQIDVSPPRELFDFAEESDLRPKRKFDGLNVFDKLKKRILETGVSIDNVPRVSSVPAIQDEFKQRIQLETPAKHVLRFTEPPADPATSYRLSYAANGTTLYFPFDRLRRIQDSAQLKQKKRRGVLDNGLLSRSIYRLMEDLEAEKLASLTLHASNRLFDRRAKSSSDEDEEPTETTLFVDKYRPKSYVDLLSDDEVMTWVKQWDQCVFHKAPSAYLKKSFKPSANNDKLGRPERRVLLLTGPPGHGKTTMANVIATQCGYTPVEINASDERSGDVFKSRIMQAIDTSSVLTGNKPNLIIIDEIDGALSGNGDGGFIKSLVELATNGTRFGIREAASKKKKAKNLTRPIICICNDPYVPALRALRACAQVYHFRKPTVTAIAKRLKHICDYEDMKIEPRALIMLLEKAEGDIRTCLNSLQMLKGKFLQDAKRAAYAGATATEQRPLRPKTITAEVIKDMAIGKKDMQRSIFNVWEGLFLGMPPDPALSTFSQALNLIESNGEYETLMNGCFEMFARMSYRDMYGWGSNTVALHEYLHLYEVFSDRMFTGSPATLVYLPIALAAFHMFTRHVGARQEAKIEFPRVEMKVAQAKKQKAQVMADFQAHMDARSRSWIGNLANFSSQVVSNLMKILAVKLRPVNPQLLKTVEKARMDRVVEVMSNLHLTYRPEKSERGATVQKLDPAIDLLGFCENESERKLLIATHAAVKQSIAGEIQKFRVLGKDVSDSENAQPVVKQHAKSKAAHPADAYAVKPKPPKALKEKIARDFFGRPIIRTEAQLAESAKVKFEKEKTKIIFKYHEGFSNAVRRTLYISDLLPKPQ